MGTELLISSSTSSAAAEASAVFFRPSPSPRTGGVGTPPPTRTHFDSSLRVACVFFDPAPADDAFAAFLEACLRFTPQLARRGNEAVYLEIGRSRHLFREESLPLRLRTLAVRFGLSPRAVTIAADPATALSAARFGIHPSTPDAFPIESLFDAATPFEDPDRKLKPAQLDRKDRQQKALGKMLETLRHLGIRTLGEFRRIPTRQLPVRFGKAGMELRARLDEAMSFAWPSWQPRETIQERLEIGSLDTDSYSGCTGLEAILHALHVALERTSARLHGRSLLASKLHVHLETDARETRTIELVIATPQRSTIGLLRLLRERLSSEFSVRPLEGLVTALELEVLETAPGLGSQRDLFLRRSEYEAEAWEELMVRLLSRAGVERAFAPVESDTHLPELAWKKDSVPVKPCETEACETKLRGLDGRPTRLLTEPVRASISGNGSRIHCSALQRAWTLQGWQGPERLSGGWWDPAHAHERDYFRVLTLEGQTLWMYRDHDREKGWMLHGWWD